MKAMLATTKNLLKGEDSSETGPRALIGIAAIVKNEGPYLLEWIAHHRAIGIERFFIADNGSDDGGRELLVELQKIGIVETFDFKTRPGVPPQLPAYAEILRRYGRMAEWLAFIDADEFIMPTIEGHTIADMLDRAGDTVGAIGLNWAAYGSSYRNTPSEGLVLERFVRRFADQVTINNHYKSLLRVKAIKKLGGTPHKFNLKIGFDYVHADLSPLLAHEKRGEGLSLGRVWKPFRLNHYVIKSKAEFDNKKQARGRATTSARRDDSFFKNHDRNEVYDPVSETLLKACRAEMAMLRSRLREAACSENLIELDKHIAGLQPTRAASFAQPGIGRLESVWIEDGQLCLRGWIAGFGDNRPTAFSVTVAGRPVVVPSARWSSRSDVMQRFPSAGLETGFLVAIPLDALGLPPLSPIKMTATFAEGSATLKNIGAETWFGGKSDR